MRENFLYSKWAPGTLPKSTIKLGLSLFFEIWFGYYSGETTNKMYSKNSAQEKNAGVYHNFL